MTILKDYILLCIEEPKCLIQIGLLLILIKNNAFLIRSTTGANIRYTYIRCQWINLRYLLKRHLKKYIQLLEIAI